MPGPAQKIRVEAVIGNIIAFTAEGSREVHWEQLCDWCGDGPLTASWEVVHVAD